MIRVFKNSIGVMLLRIVFGCYLMVTIVSTTLQLYKEYSFVEEEVITELSNVGRSFEEALASAIWAFDPTAINSILSGMQKVDAVAGVEVKNSDGKTEASAGFLSNEVVDSLVTGSILSNDVRASEVEFQIDEKSHVFYRYELKIYYDKFEGQEPQLIGTAEIYASRGTIVTRFTDSLILVLINAVFKTTALWIIFLYFSRRLLSRPLSDLTEASSSLAGDVAHSEEVSLRLEKKANSNQRNELQQLARSFLEMRSSVLDKIENLDALNHFAVALTQSKSQEAIFERLFFQLSETFGVDGAIVLGKNEELVWVSNDGDATRIANNILIPAVHDFSLDVMRGNGDIVFRKVALHGNKSVSDGDVCAMTMALLYIPMKFASQERVEIWVLGAIDTGR